ncbi:MAG: hypothetical protein JSS77_12285 [Acidobacteria bacterium]|nr:hypothetical protein [Acidobacteriota bacterium]
MKTIVAILLSLMAVGSVFAQQPAPSDYSVYRDEKYPFSLFYPKDWTQLQPTHAATRFKIAKEDGLYFTDFNINAIYVDSTKNVTPEEYVRNLIDDPQLIDAMVRQANPTAKVVARGRTYLNNRDAYFTKSEGSYRTIDNSVRLTVYQITTILEGNIYTLTFRAPTAEFDENFPVFKFIASSFVIRPTTILPPKATSSPSSGERLTTFKDSSFPLLFSYPTHWSETSFKSLDGRISLRKTAKTVISVSAKRIPAINGMTSLEYVSQLEQNVSVLMSELRSRDSTVRLIGSGRLSVGSRPAFYIKVSGTDSAGNSMTVSQVYFSAGIDLYMFQFRSSPTEYSEQYPEFLDILSSVQVN